MKKIKVNSLPEGFEIIDGRIVEVKKHGGITTGDQSKYGLVTTGTNPTENMDETSVRYSLTPVPRDEANIEAEGGETVLTDLNGDGKFGLYDIKGPRHRGKGKKGGVPLNLPPQSFIFSDFNKLLFNKQEMAEFGLETKKRLTPAKISKKYGLNEYYGKINDDYADDIQANTAQLMLKKNKEELSKLAFMQEAKKNFSDGVPVSSHPYLISKGEDPIEFTAKVEEISRQQAQQQIIESLPPEQQMQIAQLQQYMQQVDQQQGPQQQGMPPQGQGMMPPPPDMNPQQMAQMGYEMQDTGEFNSYDMPMAQGGGGGFWDMLKQAGTDIYEGIYKGEEEEKEETRKRKRKAWEDKEGERIERLINRLEKEGILPDAVRNNPELLLNRDIREALRAASESLNDLDQYDPPLTVEEVASNVNDIVNQQAQELPDYTTQTTTQTTTPGPDPKKKKRSKRNQAYDPKISEEYRKKGLDPEDTNIGADFFKDLQAQKDEYYGDAIENIEGFKETWEGIYPELEGLLEALETSKGQGKIPEVGAFQTWFNDHYIPDVVQKYGQQMIESGKDWTEDDGQALLKQLAKDYGFNKNQKGRGIDQKFGTWSSSRRPLDLTPEEAEEYIEPAEKYIEPAEEVKKPLDVPDYASTYRPPIYAPWMQDLILEDAIADTIINKYGPWQPPVQKPELDKVLEDPTRGIAAQNEQFNIMAQGMGAIMGSQQYAANMAQQQGKNAANLANWIGSVNNRNVSTINKTFGQQANFDWMANQEQDRRHVAVHDGWNKTNELHDQQVNAKNKAAAEQRVNTITNAANTFNLNTINPYYAIDPRTGGIINQINSKAWDYAEQPTSQSLAVRTGDFIRKYEAETQRPITNKVIEAWMKNQYPQQQTPQETNMQRQYYRQPQGFDNRYSQTGGQYMQEGGEVKPIIVPFFRGATGI